MIGRACFPALNPNVPAGGEEVRRHSADRVHLDNWWHRDKLSSVWYIIVMSIVSLLGTLANRIPTEWTARPALAATPVGLSPGAAD